MAEIHHYKERSYRYYEKKVLYNILETRKYPNFSDSHIILFILMNIFHNFFVTYFIFFIRLC